MTCVINTEAPNQTSLADRDRHGVKLQIDHLIQQGSSTNVPILYVAHYALLRPIHDRMPVVINDGWAEAWLLPEAAAELRGLEALMGPWDPAGWEEIPVDWL
jgi:putative SOS response-associated peptidase YedK